MEQTLEKMDLLRQDFRFCWDLIIYLFIFCPFFPFSSLCDLKLYGYGTLSNPSGLQDVTSGVADVTFNSGYRESLLQAWILKSGV